MWTPFRDIVKQGLERGNPFIPEEGQQESTQGDQPNEYVYMPEIVIWSLMRHLFMSGTQ